MEEPKSLDSAAAGGIVSREELYKLVWAEPMLKVAAQFGVSSSYMARVCTSMNVPRPERGYWAKLAVGKSERHPALPDAEPDDLLIWGRDVDLSVVAKPLPQPPAVPSARRRASSRILKGGQHHLVSGAKTLFETGRLGHSSGYLKPAKRLLVDLAVSKTGLEKALSFADALFWQLEDSGHKVVIAAEHERFRRAAVDQHEVPVKNRDYSDLWSPGRSTVVYIGTLALGLTIIELSEAADAKIVNSAYIRLDKAVAERMKAKDPGSWWLTKHDFPSGRLCLQAYCPYWQAEWTKQWREAKDEDLKKRIPSIVKELIESAPEIVKLVEKGERQAALEHQQWEENQKKWERERAEKRAAGALKKSKEQLLKFIDTWAEAKRINEFFSWSAFQNQSGLARQK
jgi:hypothetical protein